MERDYEKDYNDLFNAYRIMTAREIKMNQKYQISIRKNKNYKKAIKQLQQAYLAEQYVITVAQKMLKEETIRCNNLIRSYDQENINLKGTEERLNKIINDLNNKIQVLQLDLAHEKEVTESMTKECERLKEKYIVQKDDITFNETEFKEY